jgi:hypothetical protein
MKKLRLVKTVNLLIANSLDALEKKELKVTPADLLRVHEAIEARDLDTQPIREVVWVDGWE